jgi:F0F1-type ATP synthase alpha subunit
MKAQVLLHVICSWTVQTGIKLLMHLPIGRGQREFSYWRSSTGKTAILYWFYYNQARRRWWSFIVFMFAIGQKHLLYYKFDVLQRFNAKLSIVVCYSFWSSTLQYLAHILLVPWVNFRDNNKHAYYLWWFIKTV